MLYMHEKRVGLVKTFIAAIPLFDVNMQVMSYYLQTYNSEKPLGLSVDFLSFGDMMFNDGLDTVEAIGVEPFAGDKTLFCDVNHLQILMGVPTDRKIPPERLVVVLPRQSVIDSALVEKCMALKKAGYALALELNDEAGRSSVLFTHMDYIIVSASRVNLEGVRMLFRPLTRKQRIVVTDIPNMDAFLRYGNVAQTWYAGSFYNQPVTKGTKGLSPMKITTLALLDEVNQEDVDLVRISRTIERDPALSISLLRFINSTTGGTRRRFESIRNAVAMLGQRELIRWVSVALSVQLADDRPNEITRLSLIRAKFAENLAPLYNQGVFMHSLFMAGLFSMLDVILQKPMEEALQEIRVDARVQEALLNHRGELYDVLDLIYGYERADWDRVSINLIQHGIDAGDAVREFLNALVWYKELLDDMNG